MKQSLRIGTRGSQLALYQAELVRSKITNDLPFCRVEIVKIKTSGDMFRRGGNDPFITKRIWTKEIEDAMLNGEIDIAVHSAKDLAVLLPEGLKVGAVLEREDSRDCLVSRDGMKISEFPLGSRIGTSSLRRKMQLLRWNPELIVEELHGNVDTRIRKLGEGACDGIVLAYAGLKRLGLTAHVSEIFDPDEFLPAPGQGIIVIESRSQDSDTDDILRLIHHGESAVELAVERSFLRRLEGGCQLPCGIRTKIIGKRLLCHGAIFATQGHEFAEAQYEGSIEDAEKVGEVLADQIILAGGRAILEQLRQEHEKKS